MRKLNYLFIGAMLASVACSGGNKNDSGDDANADVRIDTFYSADLNYADLRGHVKECVTISRDLEKTDSGLVVSTASSETKRTERFNDKGMITDVISNVVFEGENVESMSYTFTYDENGALKRGANSMEGTLLVKRDADGYVSMFASIGSAGDKEFVKYYNWADGRLSQERMSNDEGSDVANKTTYVYDKDAYRLSMSESFGDPEIAVTETETTYDNKKVDKHGNWTERIVTKCGKRYDCNIGGKRTLAETVTTYLIENRDITYY